MTVSPVALDLVGTLQRLAARRPVFHSEADLQHELAWQLKLEHEHVQVRLERRPDVAVRQAADLWIEGGNGRAHVIEVKYIVRRADLTVAGERFVLTDQSAHDTRRYDVLRDVARVERWTAAGLAERGSVVVLTNDPGYWRPSTRRANDTAFRIHEDRQVTGELAWASTAAPKSIRGREVPIELAGSYLLQWRDYAELPDGTVMRALVIHAAAAHDLGSTQAGHDARVPGCKPDDA